MSLALIFGCLWVVASAIVAMLPMRLQYVPGMALLVAAPMLLIWLAMDHGWLLPAIGLFAFVSMFRNPLRYFWKRAKGERPEIPV